jgi:PAS domain S-box-containing protein
MYANLSGEPGIESRVSEYFIWYYTIIFAGLYYANSTCKMSKTRNIRTDDLTKYEVSNTQTLNASVKNVDVLLWTLREEPTGQFFYENVSEVFASSKGGAPSDFAGKPVRDFNTAVEYDELFRTLSIAKSRGVYVYEKEGSIGNNNTHFIIRIVALAAKGGASYYIALASDVAEQKTAELELEKERNRIREYLNIAGVMLLVIGADQKVKMINRKGCELLGFDEKDIVGKNWFDNFLPHSIRKDVRNRFLILMNGKEPYEFYENPVLSCNGQQRLILWHSSLLRDESQKITGLLSSGEDITERKSVEKELNRHCKTIESLFELSTKISSSSAIDELLDLTSNFLSNNPGVLAGAIVLHDEKTGEFEIHNRFGLHSHLLESYPFSNDYFKRVLKSKSAVRDMLKVEIQDAVFEAIRIAIAMRTIDKNVGLLCLLLKEADEYTFNFLELVASELGKSIIRKKAEQELFETKQLLERITYTSPAFITIYEINTEKVLFRNHSLLRYLGYPEDEAERISNLPAQDALIMYHPDDVQLLIDWEKKNLTLKDGEVNEAEYRIKTFKGDFVWFRHLSAVFLRDSRGVPVQVVNIFENINEKKKSEEIVVKRNKEIQLLYEAGEQLSRTLDLDELYSTLFNIVCRIAECEELLVTSFDPDAGVIRYDYIRTTEGTIDPSNIPPFPIAAPGKGIVSEAIRKGEPVIYNDLESTTETVGYSVDSLGKLSKIDHKGHIKPGSSMLVPIKIDDKVVGIIQIYTRNKNAYNEDQLKVLESLSLHVASAGKNAYLFKQAQDEINERKRAEEILSSRTDQIIRQQNALLEISRMKDYDLDTAFRFITEITAAAANVERTSIWLFNSDLTEVTCRDMYEIGASSHQSGIKIKAEDFSKYLQNIKTDKSILTNEAEIDPRTRDFAQKYLVPFGTTAMLVARVRVHGDVIGFISFETRNPRKKEWSVEEYDFALSVSGFISMVLESEERKRAELEIKNSLKEKELLLREIHHRVKNNLQVISSLLYLQSKKIKDQKTLNTFLESQNRIRTMVLVHEKLYQSKDFARINYADYIRSLANSVVQTFRAESSGIKLNVDVQEVFFDIDTAIHCGLIINELVSNSLKHAFAKNKEGTISINLYMDKSGEYTLTVSDNGTGFPKGVNVSDTDSLGLRLVTNLVEQLEGTIETNIENGTTFTIKFFEKKTDEGGK